MLQDKKEGVIDRGSLGTRQRLWLGTAIALLCSLLVTTSFEGARSARAQEATATETGASTDATVPGTVPPTRPTVAETLTSTPTETPTATFTPTVTPTPTPRPLHLPLLFRELRPVQDGGFESGQLAPHWQVEGNLGVHISAGLRHGGQYAAVLGDPGYNSNGGCPVGMAAISQTFDVPKYGRSTLHLWYRIRSYDTVDFDFFAVDIALWPQGPFERRYYDGCTNWTGLLWDSWWREAVIRLDDYRGRTVTVRLGNYMTNDDGWYNTWTYVDDMALVTETP